MKLTFALTLTTILATAGCAATTKSLGSSGGEIPPRPASATYPGWEHYCASIDGGRGYREAAAQLMRDAGKQGWELVSLHEISGDLNFCFKRPLIDEAPGVAPATVPAPAAVPAPAPVSGDAPVSRQAEPPTAETGGLSEDPATAFAQGIRKLDEDTYEIDRALVVRLFTEPGLLGSGVRIVPSIQDGKPNGLKLYAIRPGSACAHLGLSNGDTLHWLNGFPLFPADKALEVLVHLRDASSFELELTRRGKPRTLGYTVR